jgi:protein TonB
MKQAVCYTLAVVLHLAVLFGIAAPAPPSIPVKEDKQYLEVTLTAAPPPPETLAAPAPEIPPPPPPPPIPPPPEPPPPPEQITPPPPPPPDALTLPEPVPVQPALMPQPAPSPAPMPAVQTPPAPVPVAQTASVSLPVASLPPKYVGVLQPSFQTRVEPDYPLAARRQHQQGAVTLGLYINELGTLDKVEIVKSSGHPALDDAAADAMRQSSFHPAYQGATPVPSHGEITINFRLQ